MRHTDAFTGGRNDDAPDRIRTCDLRLRRPTLYPAELQTRCRWDGRGRRITVTPPARQIMGSESHGVRVGKPTVAGVHPTPDRAPIQTALKPESVTLQPLWIESQRVP